MMKFSCSAKNAGILDDAPWCLVARANQNYGNQEYERAHRSNRQDCPCMLLPSTISTIYEQ